MYGDDEYMQIMHSDNTNQLYICFLYQSVDGCYKRDETDRSLVYNLNIEQTSSKVQIDVCLCRKTRYGVESDTINFTGDCLDNYIEDSQSLFVHSPSFDNYLATELSGHNKTQALTVGVLVSTLDAYRYPNDSEAVELQFSLVSYMLSMSSNIYMIVPNRSMCNLISAISLTCCSFLAPGEC